MSTEKAPLPDEVEKAIFTLIKATWLSYAQSSIETIRSHIDAQAEKIALLEASNKRLREAAEIALGHMTGGLDGNYADCDPVEKLQAALAQEVGE